MKDKTSIKPLTEESFTQKESWYTYYLQVLVQGVIASLPIVIIIFILSLGFKFIFNILSPINSLLNPNAEETHWWINILSLIVLLSFFFAVGWMIRHKTGRQYFKSIENDYLCRVPLYSTVRDLVQQFSGIKKMPFSQVVLIDIFGTGVWMTGFVTEEINKDLFTVFVPTAPNPTNGNIYHVPASRLKFINVKTEGAMRTVVGMGTGSSCLFDNEDPEQLAMNISTDGRSDKKIELNGLPSGN